MSDEPNGPILTALAAFEQTLPRTTPADAAGAAARVRYHCGRLAEAARYSHAEGIRFAAYTIGRILATDPSTFPPESAERYAEVRRALEAAGHHV